MFLANLLDQIKALEPAETADIDDSQDLENDFNFDCFIDKKDSKKSLLKKQPINETPGTSEKSPNRKNKPRRNSTCSDGSLSPTMPFLENLRMKDDEMPVSRRTRKSLAYCAQTEQESFESLYSPPAKFRQNEKRKGKGRGRGRDRGRGRGSTVARQFVRNVNTSANSTSIDLQLLPNEVLGHEDCAADEIGSTLNIVEGFLHQGRRRRSRCMLARRQYLAEIAARSTNVDYVDLVSSPMPRVEGFIDLELYAEEASSQRTTRSKKRKNDKVDLKPQHNLNSTKSTLDTSLDEDNPEMNIKVNWKGKPEAFKLRKHQKFFIIFEQLAKRENIDIGTIVFNLNDRIISAHDTPDDINYKVFHFIGK